ncbi:MAG: thymidine phosphorylase [Candidatus Sericytochromatia bacterium]|nr:thymidine phosphorylase [Candidatus Sericytochromatia bacterium]
MPHPFSMIEMIRAKREGHAHDTATLAAFVQRLVAGELPDYQVAAWLMATVWRGMTIEETTDLTRLVAESGDVLDLSDVPGPCVDKHSTGGVGDKVTLVFAPLLAAAGLTVAKLSGRGLGHTGGTIDKLEAIPGMRAGLSEVEFLDQLRTVRAAVATQTRELAPADGILYALRDVTATVESIPLIAVSVLSKKIAAGAEVILLDVKAGAGAFMPSVAAAEELSRTMLEVGRRLGKRVICVVTGMDQPLGCAIGHANEVAEAIATLKGQGPADLTALCLRMGGLLLHEGGLVDSDEAGEARLREVIADGRALAKWREMIVAQGGDPRVIDDPTLLPQARLRIPVCATQAGYVQRLDALGIGLAAKALGGGRQRKDEAIDLAVGVQLLKKEGDRVEPGEPLAELLANHETRAAEAAERVLEAYTLGTTAPTPAPLIKSVLRAAAPAGLLP